MDRKNETVEHLSNKGKVYEIKVGDINVEMCYAENNKKINECMLNILKQKIKKNWIFWLYHIMIYGGKN